jgi:hypothetical protein
MAMWWVTIGIFVFAGVALILWRKDLAEVQAMLAGARMPPGCAVAEGVVLLIIAVIFFFAVRSGAFG